MRKHQILQTKPSSIVSTAVPTTAIPTTLPTENHNKKEDAPVGYAEANYFKEKVKDIIYYKDGKKHTIAPDTEEGKQIILMAKQQLCQYRRTCFAEE